MNTSFHLSLPCLDIETTQAFYLSVGATPGRHAQNWTDINLFNHQITFTKAGKFDFNNPNYVFEGKILPSFHFGVIVDDATWRKIYAKLKAKNMDLVTKAIFLKDRTGEHSSFFIKDPNDYMIEFKSFKNEEDMFKA